MSRDRGYPNPWLAVVRVLFQRGTGLKQPFGREIVVAQPWIWSQHWHDLLFLHWRVDHAALRAHIPDALEIDTHDGAAWVSLVLFRLRVRPRWLPFMPGVSDLVEVNLRTYIHCQGKPGIWFLSVHADNRWAIRLARRLTPIPYEHARMTYQSLPGRYQFQASEPRAALTFQPSGLEAEPREHSLDEWLLERYRLFARGRDDLLLQADVEHPRWVTQSVAVSASANGFGVGLGLDLSRAPEQVHFSRGVWARFGTFRRLENTWPLSNGSGERRGVNPTCSAGSRQQTIAAPGFPPSWP